jgi:hypothetical protein
MEARQLTILELLAQGPAPLKLLEKSIPKSSLHRHARQLLERAMIAKEGESYVILPRGREAFEAEKRELATRRRPRLPLPHLDRAPTEFHRAVLELVAAAAVVRSQRLRPSSHLAFVVYGPALRWKTWIAKAACLMLGADPAKNVLLLSRESGRSLTTRQGSRGERVSERATLSERVVGLDEWTRAATDVRKQAELYLWGSLEVADEGKAGKLEVRCVPVVTMNPKEGETLEERLLMDGPTIRRSILVDLAKIEIPPSLLADGERILENLASMGPAPLPLVRAPEYDPRDRVKRLLDALLDTHERLSRIDVNALAQLATGATAWLDQEDALWLVLQNYCEIVEQLGWLRSDWRSRFASTFEVAEDEGAGGAGEPGEGGPEERDEKPNPYDLDAKMRALLGVLRRLRISPQEAEERLALVARLRELDVSAENVTTIAKELARIGPDVKASVEALANHLAEHGTLEESRRALAARALEAEESVRGAGEEHARLAAKLEAARLETQAEEAKLVSLRAQIATEHAAAQRTLGEERSQVLAERQRVQAGAKTLEDERRKLEGERAALKTARGQLDAERATLQRAHEALARERDVFEAEAERRTLELEKNSGAFEQRRRALAAECAALEERAAELEKKGAGLEAIVSRKVELEKECAALKGERARREGEFLQLARDQAAVKAATEKLGAQQFASLAEKLGEATARQKNAAEIQQAWAEIEREREEIRSRIELVERGWDELTKARQAFKGEKEAAEPGSALGRLVVNLAVSKIAPNHPELLERKPSPPAPRTVFFDPPGPAPKLLGLDRPPQKKPPPDAT